MFFGDSISNLKISRSICIVIGAYWGWMWRRDRREYGEGRRIGEGDEPTILSFLPSKPSLRTRCISPLVISTLASFGERKLCANKKKRRPSPVSIFFRLPFPVSSQFSLFFPYSSFVPGSDARASELRHPLVPLHTAIHSSSLASCIPCLALNLWLIICLSLSLLLTLFRPLFLKC